MKIKLIYSALTIFVLLTFAPQAKAYTTTTTSPTTELTEKTFSESFNTFLDKRKKNRAKRVQRVIVKANKYLNKVVNKLGIDLKDPVSKWLWYGLIALGASIVLYALAVFTLGFFYWIAYLASLAATVCFIIWLLKYLEVM